MPADSKSTVFGAPLYARIRLPHGAADLPHGAGAVGDDQALVLVEQHPHVAGVHAGDQLGDVRLPRLHDPLGEDGLERAARLHAVLVAQVRVLRLDPLHHRRGGEVLGVEEGRAAGLPDVVLVVDRVGAVHVAAARADQDLSLVAGVDEGDHRVEGRQRGARDEDALLGADLLEPVLRAGGVGVGEEAVAVLDAVVEGSLHRREVTGRQDHLVRRQIVHTALVRGVGVLDDIALAPPVYVDDLTGKLPQGHLGVGVGGRVALPLGQVLPENPPRHDAGHTEGVVPPLLRPLGAVRLLVGPLQEVLRALAAQGDTAGLDVEHVLPVGGCLAEGDTAVAVALLPLYQAYLQRRIGEVEQPDGGEGAREARADDRDAPRAGTCTAYGVVLHAALAHGHVRHATLFLARGVLHHGVLRFHVLSPSVGGSVSATRG
nr:MULTISPECIES: hypothetical protein [unclassified Streptomyces]